MGDTPGDRPHEERVGEATTAPAPSSRRGARLAAAVRTLAVVSVQFVAIAVAVAVLGYLAGQLWFALLPVILALLVSTVLWPATRFLRTHGWPPALAALVVVLVFMGVLGGAVALIAPPVAGQVSELAAGASSGLQRLQNWLTGPPLRLGEDQVGQAVDQLIDSAQANAVDIADYTLTAVTAIGSALVDVALALILTFFFLKDGPRWLPWLAAQTGPRLTPHLAALGEQAWRGLGDFVRLQALIGFFDALFIGLGLLILGVPLVLPLAVITFFGAFVPIVGAFVAGAFAVLIALVSDGLGTALIALAIVVVVQQVEGNVLQPIVQGRGFRLHPAVILMAVFTGSGLAGIIGAFLAVPLTALLTIGYRYARDLLDGHSPEVRDDGTTTRIAGDDESAYLVREAADQGPPATPGSTGT